MQASATKPFEAFDVHLADYIRFTKQDAKAIQNVAIKLGPHLPSIVETVREQLSDRFPERADDVYLGKEPLQRYLGRIMTGPYDTRFSSYLQWIADNPEEVDPVYINAVLGTLHSTLIQRIIDLKRVAETATLDAFTKLLWLQSHYFLQRYLTTAHPRPTATDSVYGIPGFLRHCPAFPVVLGATLGGLTVWIGFRKKVLG